MGKSRLEAFSDGVLAIIITIMVLEMKVPHGDNLGTLAPIAPVFVSYVLSFVYLGIYWNNHHHLAAAAAYWSLQERIIAAQGPRSKLKAAWMLAGVVAGRAYL